MLSACDVGGHYSRPDVFKLLVNREPLERVIERAGLDVTARTGVDVAAADTSSALSSATDNEQETT